jgi:pimeloyl-ACP methyl ester carboxylesterase
MNVVPLESLKGRLGLSTLFDISDVNKWIDKEEGNIDKTLEIAKEVIDPPT